MRVVREYLAAHSWQVAGLLLTIAVAVGQHRMLQANWRLNHWPPRSFNDWLLDLMLVSVILQVAAFLYPACRGLWVGGRMWVAASRDGPLEVDEFSPPRS